MTDSLYCIEVTLEREHPPLEEAVEAALWQLGAAGVERQDPTTFSNLVEDPRPYAPGTVRWRVYMEPPEDEAACVAAFDDVLGEVATVDGWRLDDLSFLTAWKEFFAPAQVSDRVIVHPPWDRPPVPDGVVAVEIEPGMAFGTGTHETTRLCLRALDRLLGEEPRTVFDVGCGSGVLAIAAEKLGATEVAAMDNDPDAVRIANENFVINDVVVRADTVPLTPVRGRFDVVVANILPHVLIALRDELLAHMKPDGVLLLSGIVDAQVTPVVAAFTDGGAVEVGRTNDGSWWAVEMRLA